MGPETVCPHLTLGGRAGQILTPSTSLRPRASPAQTKHSRDRLGIGQVLDYCHAIRTLSTEKSIIPVLVVQRQPTDPKWVPLASSLGIVLTWPPEFAGF